VPWATPGQKEDADKTKASHEAGELPDAKTEGDIPSDAEERRTVGSAEAGKPAVTNGHADSDDTSSDGSSGDRAVDGEVGQRVEPADVDDVDVFSGVDTDDEKAAKAGTKAERNPASMEEALASVGTNGKDMAMMELDSPVDDGSKKDKKKKKKKQKQQKKRATSQDSHEVEPEDLDETKDQDLASSGIELEGTNAAMETDIENQAITDTKPEGQIPVGDGEGTLSTKSDQKKDKKKKKKQKPSPAALESTTVEEEEEKKKKPEADYAETETKKEKKRKREVVVNENPNEDGPSKKTKKKKTAKKEKAQAELETVSEAAKVEADADERWHVRNLEGGAARQEKFLKLLGGKKAKAASTSGETKANDSAPTAASRDRLHMGHVAEDLEKQFQAGVRMKFEQSGQRRGLGA